MSDRILRSAARATPGPPVQDPILAGLPPLIPTSCRIDTPGGADGDRLIAYATVVLNGEWLVHGVKLWRGQRGPYVTWPHREAEYPCPGPECRRKVSFLDHYCKHCGRKLTREIRLAELSASNRRVRLDVSHPTRNECRERVLQFLVEACRARGLDVDTPAAGPEGGGEVPAPRRGAIAEGPAIG